MVDQQKVSFVPKSALVREQAFLARRRPRSLFSFLAVVALVVSVGAYIVLLVYNESIERNIQTNIESAENSRQRFLQDQNIENARTFQARTSIAKELLDNHTVVTPVFEFLNNNTLSNIYYSNFSLKRAETGFALELRGEAPSYAALAYQSDIFSGHTELAHATFTGITLTRFGTVEFVAHLEFVPGFFLYTDYLSRRGAQSGESGASEQIGGLLGSLPVPEISLEVPSSSPMFFDASLENTPVFSDFSEENFSTTEFGEIPSPEGLIILPSGGLDAGTGSPFEMDFVSPVPEQQPFWSAWWSYVKFW